MQAKPVANLFLLALGVGIASAFQLPHQRNYLTSIVGSADDDSIPSVPGFGTPPSAMYSGYLQVSDTKFMHYVFVESENMPSSDPVVLWLNGGPGCSSLGGFVDEHGPFQFDASNINKLTLRPYRWSRIANVLYLESPVGVGFSYATGANDYNCTDDTTANDNLMAMESFFQKFPTFQNHSLFLTGESYAGVYVPTLAEAIMKASDSGTYNGAKLAGFAVGNGCTGTDLGLCGSGTQGTYYEWKFLLGNAFVSGSLKKQIAEECDWDSAKNNGPLSDECQDLITQAANQIGNINVYDVFGDCVSANSYENHVKKFQKNTKPHDNSTPLFKTHAKAPHNSLFSLRGPVECIDGRSATEYFSSPNVISAFHLHPLSYPFGVCTTPTNWSYISTRPNLPRDTYPALIKRYRVLIYNGDVDACVPFTDNQAWTENMGLPVQQAWRPWTYVSDSAGVGTQIGGYVVKYNVSDSLPDSSFQFITIRGGRHEVPQSAPEKALTMLSNLINGNPF